MIQRRQGLRVNILLDASGRRRPGGHKMQEDAAGGDCTISSVKGVRAGRKRGVIAGGGGMVKKSRIFPRRPAPLKPRRGGQSAGVPGSWPAGGSGFTDGSAVTSSRSMVAAAS